MEYQPEDMDNPLVKTVSRPRTFQTSPESVERVQSVVRLASKRIGFPFCGSSCTVFPW